MKIYIHKLIGDELLDSYIEDSLKIDDKFLYNLHQSNTFLFIKEELYNKINSKESTNNIFGDTLNDDMTIYEMIRKNLLTITLGDDGDDDQDDIITGYKLYTGNELKYLIIKE